MIFSVQITKHGLKIEKDLPIKESLSALYPEGKNPLISGADIEEIALKANNHAWHIRQKETISASDISFAISDIIPSMSPDVIELQEILAVIKCSSKSMLPERYRRQDFAILRNKVSELRQKARQ
jgi:hypothetical protein